MLSEITIALALLVAVFLSSKLKVSSFVVELCIGVIIGKSVLNIVEPTEWITFLSDLGLLFLLFLAGIEANLSKYRRLLPKGLLIGAVSFVVPLGALYAFMNWYGGFSFSQIVIVCAALITTSMAVVYPFLKEYGVADAEVGKKLMISVIVVGILSMISLSVAASEVSLWALLVLPVLFGLYFVMPRVIKVLSSFVGEKNMFHWEVRFVFAFLLLITLFLEQFGLHAAVGAYFLGLILSEFNESEEIKTKLDVIGFSFLIPFFFINVGLNLDLWSIFNSSIGLIAGLFSISWVVKTLAVFLILLPFISKKRDIFAYALLFNAPLSLGIVAAEVGIDTGLIDASLHAVLIIGIVASSIIAYFLAKNRIDRKPAHEVTDKDIYV